ncbi:hypothetical protein QL285_022025 [Trifolium repens]|nr:hypothetical protein QL285_022025 [Trifolium repens]
MSFLFGEPDRVDVVPEPDKVDVVPVFGTGRSWGNLLVIPIRGTGRSWCPSCFWNRTKLLICLSFLFGEPDEAGVIPVWGIGRSWGNLLVIPIRGTGRSWCHSYFWNRTKLASFLFLEPDEIDVIPVSGTGQSWRHSCFWNRTKLASFLFLEPDEVGVIPVSGTGRSWRYLLSFLLREPDRAADICCHSY